MIQKIQKIIKDGENNKVEFKEAKNSFPDSAFETICAFLNTDGGYLLLGVDDNAKITGINHDKIEQIKEKFVTSINNQNIINPPVYLKINDIKIDGKTIIYIEVPIGSNVHRYKGKIYKRNNESDVDITNQNEEIAKLFLSKDTTYSENKIYPYLKIKDLRKDLILKVKKLAKLANEQNDWVNLEDDEFLKSTCLYQTDYTTGNSGITLAGVLLFGTDEQIKSVAPGFKIELVKKVIDEERYDNRITLTTNLMDCFDTSMKFIADNLPSPFYISNNQRINLRDSIFREVVANMIVHKEYTSTAPTLLAIKRNEIIIQNSNKPRFRGYITPQNIVNFPKNPNIIRIFRGIGYVEDIGTGLTKVFRDCKLYTNHTPNIEEDDLFTFTLKHSLFSNIINKTNHHENHHENKTNHHENHHENKTNHHENHHEKIEKTVIAFCKTPKSLSEILQKTGYKDKGNFRKRILNPLIKKQLIQRTDPNPKARFQKYVTTSNKQLSLFNKID